MKKIIINRSILISLIFLGFIISISLIISPKKIDINNNYIFEKIQNFTYSTIRNEIAVKKNNEFINEFELIIKKKHLDKLDTLYSRYHKGFPYTENKSEDFGLNYYSKNNKRFRAKLIIKKDTFDVKIKSHGKQPDLHKYKSYISLNIKANEKIEKFLNKKISLIIYERINYLRYYDEIILLAKYFNLEFKPSSLVNVKIKNKKDHLFYVESKIDKNNIEEIFPNKKFLFVKNIFGDALISNYTFDQKEKFEKTKFTKDSIFYKKTILLNNYIKEKNIEQIIDLFNFDYLTNFQAFRTIGGLTGHGLRGENLELYFNLIDNKFYPIVHRDMYFGQIDTCDKSLKCLEQYRWNDDYGSELKLFSLIHQNQKIKLETFKKIKIFLESKKEILNEISLIKNDHEIRHYPFFINNMKYLNYEINPLKSNIEYLEKNYIN